MYIKSIVLDGFKSYGNRVEITGFDPEFNAITGLNGTGKSNILDSICFVLGITNLSNVRAGSLQELIYKHGQAGITKATVSITFNNRDKRQCPIGYENHDEITVTRQVVMGGKNKYLINGINVQNKRVSDLFCSVQLNVNNPHFLIMQGRITKVLNMKPPEILSMVEEAAGTRMYEAKKQAAQKTIEKKDAKLRELNDIIREDIAPKLQKLQDERAQFQEYQKVVRELDNLSRLLVAYRYVTAEEKAKEATGKVTEVEDEIATKKETIKENEKQAKDIDKKVVEMNKKLDEESGSVVAQLEQELQSAERLEAGAGAAHKAGRELLGSLEQRARLLGAALRDDRAQLHSKARLLEQMSGETSALQAGAGRGAARLAAARGRFLAASAGLDDSAASLHDHLIAAKQEASEASTRITQSEMELRHATTRLNSLQREHAAGRAAHQRYLDDIARHQADVDNLQAELSSLTADSEHVSGVRSRARAAAAAARSLRAALEAAAARLQRCDFHYTPPEPGFDAGRVAGTICRLIDVIDPKYCTAIETAAGGRLYNVVVDTEVTSKLLLQRGRLQARTTIIPLNKITPHVIPPDVVKLAQKIGGGADKVQVALQLVRCAAGVQPAAAWVLGNTLVCSDLETARKVTFHAGVRRRSVTLDGDVFDPAGTLAGGAPLQGGSILIQLKSLKELEQKVADAEKELSELNSEVQSLERAADHYTSVQQRYETCVAAARAARSRLAGSAHAQLHDDVTSLRAQIEELTAAIERDKVIQKEAAARAAELEAKVKDIKGHRDREFKKAELELEEAKKEEELHSRRWQAREQEYSTLRLEVEELQAAAETSDQQLQEAHAAAAAARDQLPRLQADLDLAQAQVREIQGRIKQHKSKMAARSSDITRLLADKEKLLADNAELVLSIKQLEYTIKELHTEAQDCQQKIKSLEKENSWISSERQYFGSPGGLYDFTARKGDIAAQRVQQLQQRKDKLSRGLNARAHTLLGKEEEQYQDVMQKKQIVEADRAKLVQVMAELDEKKRRTLAAACKQVNVDFGNIFSTLLPGAHAALAPPPGRSVLDGLEVRVGFNNTWKESLGELSGGQRSLVALSLVLAMLLFKPAPLYILDEVDAALDLSHTQNIGHMLKQHFKHSQFIIVSLKDGMFNNANVLFRTRFVDGMSSVQRTANTRT